MKWKCEEQNERKNSKLIGDDKNGYFWEIFTCLQRFVSATPK